MDQCESYMEIGCTYFKIIDIKKAFSENFQNINQNLFTSLLLKVTTKQNSNSIKAEDFEEFFSSGDVEKSYLVQASYFEAFQLKNPKLRRKR